VDSRRRSFVSTLGDGIVLFLERGDPIQFNRGVCDLTQKPSREDEASLIIVDQKGAYFSFKLKPLEAGIGPT
jgi:PAS domain-containing protein